MALFPQGLKLDMTKRILGGYLQKKMEEDEQTRQLALVEQERQKKAKVFQDMMEQGAITNVPPNVGRFPMPFATQVGGQISSETMGEAASRGMIPQYIDWQKSRQPNLDVMSLGKGRLGQFDPRNPSGTFKAFGLDQEQSGDLPEGYSSITNPARKAEIWNKTYGTNYSAKDFENVQERPYFNAVQDRDGKLRIFDTRTGKFAPETGDDVIKAAPTEIKLFIANLNDNLNSVKEIKKITDIGDITGVVKGRVRKFGTKFFSDTEAETLKRRLGQLRTIIYGLSGKQINESEQIWLQEEIIPQMQQPTENFEVALNEFEAWVKRKKGTLKQQFPNIQDIDEKPKDNKGKSLKDKYGLE